MKKIYPCFLVFLLMSALSTNAQDSIYFYGHLGNENDTVLYYFNNNKDQSKVILADKSGNYSLTVKSRKYNTITFQYKNGYSCPQVLNLDKIRKYSRMVKDFKIQNDLSLIQGFACVRVDDFMSEANRKYMGDWISSKNTTLKLDGYYKREFSEDGHKYTEEGSWGINGNQMELESVYVSNIEIGTFIETKRKLILKIKDGKLVSTDGGIEYIKNN